MKKSIVYSFVALSGIPVLAEAAIVPQVLPANGWGTGAAVQGDQVSSDNGGLLQQKLSLVPGKYKLIVTDMTVPAGGSVTVQVGTVKKEVKANGKVEVEFTLDAASVVDVTVQGTGIFTFKGVTVDLNFDFANAVAALQQKLNGLTETLKTYKGDKTQENEQAAGLIQDVLNVIKGNQSYENYTKYALYDLDNSSLTADINKLAKKAELDEANYVGGGLGDALKVVTDQIDKEDPNKPAFDATAKTITDAITAYKSAPTEEKKAAITTQIGDLQTAVSKSNASLPTYKANVAAVAAATAAYNDAQKSVSDLFLDQVYKYSADQKITYGNIYENLFTNAKAALAAASKKIADAQAKAVAEQKANKATNLKAEIDAAAAEAKNVADVYTTKKATINGKYDIAAALQKSLNDIKAEAGAEDLSLIKRTSAQGAIDAVKEELDGKNNAKEEVLDYKPTKVQAAEDAIAKYKRAIEYTNEYVKAKKAAADANTALASVLKDLDYKNYTPSSQYQEYTDAIAENIADALAKVEEVFQANQDAGENAVFSKYAFAPANDKIKKANDDGTALKTKATAANKTYKQVFDDAAELQKLLNEALAKIAKESPDVAAQYKGADIQTKITGWEATFARYNKALADKTVKAPAHADNVATLALGDTKANIEAAIEQLIKDAAAAQTAFGYMAPYNLRVQLEGQIATKLDAINELKGKVAALAANANFAKSVNYAKLNEAYTKLAGDVTKVDTDAKAAINNTPTSGQKTDDDKKNAVEVNKDVNAKLATYIETIAKLTTDLNASQKAIQAAIDAVTANETAKAAYDKRKAEIDKAIVDAKAEAAKSTSADAVKVAADEFKKIEEAVAAIDKKVTTAYDKPNQNLTESVWKDGLANIDKDKGSIATTLEAVKAAQANFDAYTDLNKKAAEAKVTIATYKGKVGPTKYYDGLVDGYLTSVTDEEAKIKKSYEAKTAVANKKAFEDAIKAIVDNAKKIETDAPANHKAYNGDGAQVKGQKYDVTVSLQDYYNKISFEIKSSDESTKLEEWTTKLDAIQSKINKLAADVDSYYNNGQSVAEAQDVANAITSIKKELDNLLASQKEGYNQQIADDNDARYKNFTDALASAQAAFENAVATQNEYSNVTNPELKEDIEEGTEDLIKSLYEYPVKLADLAKTTAEEYGKVTSPALYDETAEVATAKQYADEIKGIQDKLTDAALKNVSFIIYENKVNSAVAALNAKADIQKFYTVKEGDKDVVKTAAQLKDVQDIIDAGKKALEEKKIAGVDGALNALVDIDNMIAADQHKAANAQLSDRVQKLKDAIEDHLEFLAGLEGQEDLIKNYKKAVEDLFTPAEEALVEAQAAGRCFADYNKLDAKINAFETNSDVSKAKTMFETANNLPATQKLLDEAIAEVSQYHVAPDYAKTWDNFQNTLDRAKADPSVNISGLTSKYFGIPAKRTEAYNAEYYYLKTVAPVELQDQYNQLVADQFAGMENETTAKLKEKIEAIKKEAGELTNIKVGDKEAATPADLVKFNGKVAALFTEIQALYDTEIAGVTADALKDASAALAEKLAKLDGYVDVVKANAGLDAAKADIQGDIDAVNADITKYAGNIVYYSDKIQGSIDYIDGKLDDVIANADEVQEKYDAQKALYEAHVAALAELQTQLDELKAFFEACCYPEGTFGNPVVEEDFTIQEKALESLGKQLEENFAKLEVLESDQYEALKNFPSWFADLNDKYAFTEAAAHVSDLNLQLKAVSDKLNLNWSKYSKATRTAIQDEIDAIGCYSPYWESDIAAFFGNLISSINRGTEVEKARPIPALALAINSAKSVWNKETAVYENLSAEKFEEHMAEVETIQARIDALNKILENVTLGDINGDGKVSVNDYTAVVDYIINEDLTPAEGTPEFDVADVNADGKLNIADATALINIILTGDRAGNGLVNEAPARVAGSSESVNVEASDMGNGVTRLAIALDNASNYVSCQMDVKLPAGMKLVGESVANRADGHELASGDFSGGIHRIVVSSITNTAFAGNSGAVLYIDVETDDTYAGGKVIISDVIFVTPSAQVKAFSIAGEATGITGIATDNSVKGKIYDLSGRVLNAVKKGINVINGKKVFVK